MRAYDTSTTPIVGDDWLRLSPLWHGVGVAMIAAIFYLSLAPNPIDIPVEQGDKLGHVSAYAVLMFWYAQIHDDRTRRIALAVAFVGMGIMIEYLQRATGYRSFELADMAADAAGVVAGWALAPPRLPNALRYLERRVSRARRQVARAGDKVQL